MKRFNTKQALFALIILAVSIFLFTGCSKSDELRAQFDNVLPGTCSEGGPTVDRATPGTGDTGVSISAPITAFFSDAMDPATITADGTFTLYDNRYPLKNIEGTVAMTPLSLDFAATFTPTEVLDANSKYTATITKYAENKEHVKLGCSYKWEFETGNP